jgi:hypothetical protein
MLDQMVPALADSGIDLARLATDGLMQTEGEIRRGVIAMNGAGLLAVISLLSQSLHPAVLRIAATLFLLGLGCGCWGWVQRARTWHVGLHAKGAFKAGFDAVKALPVSKLPLTTVADVEAAEKAVTLAITTIAAKLKQPGKAAAFWTYVALACFFAATVALVVDFELTLRPHAVAAAHGVISGESAGPKS